MDIVERLRKVFGVVVKADDCFEEDYSVAREAADDIERLRQQNAELVNALRPFVDLGRAMLPADEYDDSVWVTMPDDTPVRNLSLYNFTVGDFRKAAKATGE